MGKQTKTIYTCDRCKKEILRTPFSCGAFRFMHVLKWWMPAYENYKLTYLCEECWKKLKQFMNEEESNEQN